MASASILKVSYSIIYTDDIANGSEQTAPGDIHDTYLARGQIDAIDALSRTGKPLVTVLVEGRPRALDTIPDRSQALVQTYLPGPWGGRGIAEVLFGQTNPSGRLPYTYPKHVGDINLNYWRQANDVYDPLYEFGHGLSYSTFEYSNLTISQTTLSDDKPVQVEMTVTNAGPMDGQHTVLMFVQQPVRRATPPAKLLKGFNKLDLKQDESSTVRFTITTDMFRYTGLDGNPNTLDTGAVKVMVGDNVADLEIV